MKKGVGLLLSSIVVVLIIANILVYIRNNKSVNNSPVVEQAHTATTELKVEADHKEENLAQAESNEIIDFLDTSDDEQRQQENEQEQSEDIMDMPEKDEVASELAKNEPYKIIPVSRHDVKLSQWDTMDLSNFSLNARLVELLDNKESYKIPDYHLGIEYYVETLVVNGLFKQPIIGDISIGTSFEDLVSILGKPTVVQKDIIHTDRYYYCYKTAQYYLVFYGSHSIELMVVSKNLEPLYSYDANILEQLLGEVCENIVSLGNYIEIERYSALLDYSSHIHGGGQYYFSKAGIVVELFGDDYSFIDVYNNFKGNLFRLEDTERIPQVNFIDKDINLESLITGLNNYISTDEDFHNLAEISHDGKYAFYHVFEYSQSFYMVIRTLDGSRPDIRLGCYGDYEWTEDNILIFEYLDKTHKVDIDEYMTAYDKENS